MRNKDTSFKVHDIDNGSSQQPYGSRPDKNVVLKGGYVYVLTKKNKGTVVGVYTEKPKAETDKDELGGERYFRISNYFINQMIYK